MITDKDNVPLVKPVVSKRKNWAAYAVLVVVVMFLVTAGVFYTAGRLADYLSTEFAYPVVSLK